MGSAVAAGIGSQIAGKLAGKVVGKVTGNEGGLLSKAASMAAGNLGGGGLDSINPYGAAMSRGTQLAGTGMTGSKAAHYGISNALGGEGGSVLGDLGEKLGGWFQNSDNKQLLYDAGLTVLPWLMDKFSDDEEIIDLGGGGGGPPPVATGGPGYSGGGAGGQYGVSWGFGPPNRIGYKPGRV